MADSRDKPKIETLNYEPPKCALPNKNSGVLANPEQPNQTREGNIEGQNLMIIDKIEGLLSQANTLMYELPMHPTRSMAIEEIDVLLRVTIKTELRKAFE